MKAAVLGTTRIVNFSCIDREGKQVAGAIMHYWGANFCGYDDDRDMHIINWADAGWWRNILARIEKLEAAGVDWDSCDYRDESSLIMMVQDLEMTLNENGRN